MYTTAELQTLLAIAFVLLLVFAYLQRAKNRDPEFVLGTDMTKIEDVVGLLSAVSLVGVGLFGSLLYLVGIDVRVSFAIGASIGLYTASRMKKFKLAEQ